MRKITRRAALKTAAATFAAPFVWRLHAHAAPSETVLHASFGAGGMAGSDLGSLSNSKHLKLVAVAEVDAKQPNLAALKKKWPDLRVYTDYRELLDKEKDLNSVNVSTPDHMHAPIAMRAINRGLHVYGQKPLTQTIYEARRLTEVAAEKKVVTQMGIQIHSARKHKLVVKLIQDGVIGKVKEVHSWSGKSWGDTAAKPAKTDPVPEGFDWDLWLGVASERPFIKAVLPPRRVAQAARLRHRHVRRHGLPHPRPGVRRHRRRQPQLHPLRAARPERLQLVARRAGEVRVPRQQVHHRPGLADVVQRQGAPAEGGGGAHRQAPARRPGFDLIGTEGVMYSQYDSGNQPILLGEKFKEKFTMPEVKGDDHYLQYVEAVRGNGTTSAPFSYSGPLTEMVLLGCLATRFPKTDLTWDTKAVKVTNNDAANAFVRKTYRKGHEVEGL